MEATHEFSFHNKSNSGFKKTGIFVIKIIYSLQPIVYTLATQKIKGTIFKRHNLLEALPTKQHYPHRGYKQENPDDLEGQIKRMK